MHGFWERLTSPVVGETKAADLELSEKKIIYLEELYILYKLVGAMAQNTFAAAKENHKWPAESQSLDLSVSK